MPMIRFNRKTLVQHFFVLYRVLYQNGLFWYSTVQLGTAIVVLLYQLFPL